MVEKGVSPDVVTYSSLIQGFSCMGRVHAHIVKLTKRDRVLPQFHYVIVPWELNNGCGKPGFYDPMIELEKTDLGTLVNSQLMCSECLQGQFLL
ncbi:hypothetical protein AAC387_Pa08g2608 [Persea americana]